MKLVGEEISMKTGEMYADLSMGTLWPRLPYCRIKSPLLKLSMRHVFGRMIYFILNSLPNHNSVADVARLCSFVGFCQATIIFISCVPNRSLPCGLVLSLLCLFKESLCSRCHFVVYLLSWMDYFS